MPPENTTVATIDQGVSAVGFLQDDALFSRVERFAQIMSTGRATIPKELQNPGDCMAITLQALQWKMNPISLAQKVFFINGRIGYEAQAIAAAINTHDSISSPFAFEWYGPWEKVIGKFEIKRGDKGEYRVPGWKLADEEGCGIRVSATLRGEAAPRVMDLLLAQARTRNSTQWADDPKQQLAYLAQKKWARLYAPHIILGAYTPDELEPIPMQERDITPTQPQAPAVKPEYPDERLAQKLPEFKKKIEAGNSAASVIAFLSANYTLSPAQQARINALEEPAPIEGEARQVDDFLQEMAAEEAQQ